MRYAWEAVYIYSQIIFRYKEKRNYLSKVYFWRKSLNGHLYFAICLFTHVFAPFKKISWEEVFMYVWKRSCVDKAEREHMLKQKLCLVAI